MHICIFTFQNSNCGITFLLYIDEGYLTTLIMRLKTPAALPGYDHTHTSLYLPSIRVAQEKFPKTIMAPPSIAYQLLSRGVLWVGQIPCWDAACWV